MVLTYVNCSAEIKALSDIIVTSSNAEHIINQLPKDQKIIFAPDRHLGAYLNKKTGRNMVLWPGTCIVHEQFSERELIRLKSEHPGAPVAAHPECPEHILAHADHIGSTSSILNFALTSPSDTFIIVDRAAYHPSDGEEGAAQDLYRRARRGRGLRLQQLPVHGTEHDREALSLPWSTSAPQIDVPEATRLEALKPLERMLEMSPKSSPNSQPAPAL